MASSVPRPGPANLGPNAGLDEWLEEAKQCHYLPERAMKELCEKVKEILMEGRLAIAGMAKTSSSMVWRLGDKLFDGPLLTRRVLFLQSRVQHPARLHTSNRLWRHSRPILRFAGAFPRCRWNARREQRPGSENLNCRHHIPRYRASRDHKPEAAEEAQGSQ